MKRIILTLSCIISVFWFMPLFVHASYTAPNGVEYENMVTTDGGSDSYGFYCTMYSNDKFCFCDQYRESFHSSYRYQVIGLYRNGDNVTAGPVQSHNGSYDGYFSSGSIYPSGINVGLNENVKVFYHNQLETTTSTWYAITSNNPNVPIFETLQECYDYLTTPDVDFENLYYDPTVPTPEFIVQMERPTPWQDVSDDTNFFNITFNEYGGYFVQIGYKFSYPNGMKVGLVDGQVTYTPLTYANSVYYDVYSLEDMKDASNINGFVNAYSFEPESQPIQDAESWQTTVPIWANNFNNAKYVNARNKWNTKMRYCWPLYGNKLEIFARLFYVDEGACYVGAWKHWNNSYPSEYQEEIPNNYQVGSAMPGYSNTSNQTDYQEQENTETSIGTQTGVNTNPTVIVNNLTPNYPDYPTVATYNHDNLLLQFFTTAKQLPSSFNGFTSFLAASFTWIPSYIWDIIAFGLLASITVMVIKIL